MLHVVINHRIFRFLSFALVLLLLIPLLRGQATGDSKEDFLYGEYYLIQGLYREALPFYLSSLEAMPDNSNLNYRVGLCYERIIGEQHKALPYLKKSVKEINAHYIDGKYANTGAPIEAWLLLGDAYLRSDQLMEASRAYHEYKRLIGDSDPEMFKEVMARISGLGVSYEYQRENTEVCMINMGNSINSRFSDYNPVVSGDQKVMVYSQFWESYDRILLTRMTENGWAPPEDISTQVESEGVCYTSAISFDGKELYFVCHDEMNYDLFISVYENDSWSGMKPIGGKVNSRYRESSVCISADGNELYFASDRPGGEGGFDLYYAEKTAGEWSTVVNLGKPINTKGNEEAPYLSYDGTVLYFSSNSHETVGNMDILFSSFNETGNWQEPVNIGIPVNTTNDDIFYTYFKDTQTGYLSRDIPEGSGKNDIYRIQFGDCPLLTSDGVVVKETSKPLMALSADNSTTEEKINTSANLENDNTKVITQEQYDTPGDTSLVDYNFIEKQLEEALGDSQKTGEFTGQEEAISDSVAIYTIQIYALHKPINSKGIKLSPVKISKGDDGLYRYTFEEFAGYSNARKKLDEIWVSGYPDAFIRNISTVPNYAH